MLVWLYFQPPKTQLGATEEKDHTATLRSTSYWPVANAEIKSRVLLLVKLYQSDRILVQAIFILGAHLIIWKLGYLYCYLSTVVMSALDGILHPIFRESMPQSYDRMARQANDWKQWLETATANLQLIEVPRLISTTIFFWPMRDVVMMFELVRDLAA